MHIIGMSFRVVSMICQPKTRIAFCKSADGSSQPRSKSAADDRPRFLSAGDLAGARVVVEGLGPEPHEVWVASRLLVDWICLEQRGAVRASIVDRAPQQYPRDALTPLFRIHEETHDRPHGFLIDALHHPGALQARIVLAGPQGNPADRPSISVGDEPRHRSAIHECLHGSLICLSPAEATAPRFPIVHTPAPPDD